MYTELFRIDYARSGANNTPSYLYGRSQPNAYIAFKGPGITGPIEVLTRTQTGPVGILPGLHHLVCTNTSHSAGPLFVR